MACTRTLWGPRSRTTGSKTKSSPTGFADPSHPPGKTLGRPSAGPLTTNPHLVVLAEAINDVVAYGCLRQVPVEREAGRRRRGQPTTQLQPLPLRIDALRDRADIFRHRWAHFAQTETALFTALEKTIATNLHRRKVQDTDNDWSID